MAISEALYRRAVYVVTNDRKAATSYVQRKLQIGYNSAASIIERMEQEGFIGPADHVGKREILVGPTTDYPDLDAADTPPFETDTPADQTSAPSPEPEAAPAPPPVYDGPLKRFTCSGCNASADGPVNGLPHGWYEQVSGKLGNLPRCTGCAKRHASRIATQSMSTEQILTAGSDGAHVDAITSAAQGQLKSFVERIERLIEDAQAIAHDIKDVKAECKGQGFDIAVLMMVIRDRAKDKQKLAEQQALYDLYLSAIGGL